MADRAINNVVAADVAVWAMMAGNCYRSALHFDLEPLGWQVFSRNKESGYLGAVSGLAYDAYQHQDGRVVLAIRGSDGWPDWIMANLALPFSFQYKSAFKHYREIIDQCGRIDLVTGHSLGGGIALGMSVRYGVEAMVFDTSPRIFDGLWDVHKQAKRRHVYQKGDPLQFARNIWPKYQSISRSIDTWVTDFDFRGASNHTGTLLARGLAELGAEHDPDLKKVVSKLDPPLVHPRIDPNRQQ
jgi:hypothetical protein